MIKIEENDKSFNKKNSLKFRSGQCFSKVCSSQVQGHLKSCPWGQLTIYLNLCSKPVLSHRQIAIKKDKESLFGDSQNIHSH